jgi:hypothetical protein
VRSFIAEVLKDTKADKPAKIIKFNDGAEVMFYVKPHARARKNLKHVHLSNENVKFLVPKAGASSSSSPTESAGSKARMHASARACTPRICTRMHASHPHAHARLASAHACTPRIRTRMHASHLHAHARLVSARACTPRRNSD